MSTFILSRAVQAGLTILAVSIIVFMMTHLTGDPVNALLPVDASAEQYDQLRHELGLDRPLYVQYLDFIGGVLTGDLGASLRDGRPVLSVIASRLPATLELAGVALALSVLIGLPLGIYAAYWQHSWFDRLGRWFAVLGQSVPKFWIGILLILLFAVQLGWLPVGGRGSFSHVLLPAFAMAWALMAGVTRLTRSSLLEILEKDYMRLCRIKGMPEHRLVLWKHGLRNAALPVLTYSAVITGILITGSVVIEEVFTWPGIGKLLIESIGSRDFPMVQGIVLMFSAAYVAMNLAIDLLYAYLNPRLRRD